MNEVNNTTMKELIINWGLPKCINRKKDSVIFKFNDDGINNTKERGYHCKNGNVKFCLFDKTERKALFSMDFFKSNQKIIQARNRKPGIRLELLYVHDETLRRKGISSYYIEKLQAYAIHEKMDCIYIRANADARNFKDDSNENSLSQRQLEKFYKKRSTKEMPIILER